MGVSPCCQSLCQCETGWSVYDALTKEYVYKLSSYLLQVLVVGTPTTMNGGCDADTGVVYCGT